MPTMPRAALAVGWAGSKVGARPPFVKEQKRTAFVVPISDLDLHLNLTPQREQRTRARPRSLGAPTSNPSFAPPSPPLVLESIPAFVAKKEAKDTAARIPFIFHLSTLLFVLMGTAGGRGSLRWPGKSTKSDAKEASGSTIDSAKEIGTAT